MIKIALTSYYIPSEKFNHKEVRGVVGQDMILTTADYMSYVYDAGGFPVLVSPFCENCNDYIGYIAENTDMLFLTGGEDTDPSFYDMPSSPYLGEIIKKRDEFEFKLTKAFLKQNKPVFGVCRGFQLLNIFFKGTLYRDYRELDKSLSYHCEQPYQKLVHKVNLETELSILFKDRKISVNSHHHQFIKELGEGLKVLATAEDGVIEAFENKNKKIFAVQWHPEMIYKNDLRHLELLKNFIENTVK